MWLFLFVTSVLAGDEESALRPYSFARGEIPLVFNRRFTGPQGQSGRFVEKKNVFPLNRIVSVKHNLIYSLTL